MAGWPHKNHFINTGNIDPIGYSIRFIKGHIPAIVRAALKQHDVTIPDSDSP